MLTLGIAGPVLSGVIGTVTSALGNALLFVINALNGIPGAIISFTNQIMQYCALAEVKMGGVGKTALCIAAVVITLITFFTRKGRASIVRDVEKTLESSWLDAFPRLISDAYILAPILYYPSVLFLGFFVKISGNGDNLFLFSSMIDEEFSYTFSNYMLWNEAARYLCAFVVIKLLMRVAVGLLRFRFFKVLRSLAVTVFFLLLGVGLGHVWLLMAELAHQSILYLLLFFIPMFCLYLSYIYLVIAFVLPLYVLVLPPLLAVLAPILGLSIAMVEAIGESNYEMLKEDMRFHGDFAGLWALKCAEEGYILPLVFMCALDK